MNLDKVSEYQSEYEIYVMLENRMHCSVEMKVLALFWVCRTFLSAGMDVLTWNFS